MEGVLSSFMIGAEVVFGHCGLLGLVSGFFRACVVEVWLRSCLRAVLVVPTHDLELISLCRGLDRIRSLCCVQKKRLGHWLSLMFCVGL